MSAPLLRGALLLGLSTLLGAGCSTCWPAGGEPVPCADIIDADGDQVSDAAGDCDDLDPARSPLFDEVVCDGVDNDCDTATEDAPDADGDGFDACGESDTVDPDGLSGDCDDGDAAVGPEQSETLCDGVDNDCDGLTEDAPDADGDGHDVCDDDDIVDPDDRRVDCDDTNPDIAPNEDEIACTGLDEDCDEDSEDGPDADGDGYDICGSEDLADPDGLTVDCDDSDATLSPGVDADSDGTSSCEDCDDGDPATAPGAPEEIDGQDNDCDGDADEVLAHLSGDSLLLSATLDRDDESLIEMFVPEGAGWVHDRLKLDLPDDTFIQEIAVYPALGAAALALIVGDQSEAVLWWFDGTDGSLYELDQFEVSYGTRVVALNDGSGGVPGLALIDDDELRVLEQEAPRPGEEPGFTQVRSQALFTRWDIDELVYADFDGDGEKDLLVCGFSPGDEPPVGCSLAIGLGGRTFEDEPFDELGAAITSPIRSIAGGQLGRDAVSTLLVGPLSNDDPGSLRAFDWDGDSFSETTLWDFDPENNGSVSGPNEAFSGYVAVGDANGDGIQDIAALYSTDDTGDTRRLDVLLGNGDGSFQEPTTVADGLGPSFPFDEVGFVRSLLTLR